MSKGKKEQNRSKWGEGEKTRDGERDEWKEEEEEIKERKKLIVLIFLRLFSPPCRISIVANCLRTGTLSVGRGVGRVTDKVVEWEGERQGGGKESCRVVERERKREG